MSVVVGYTPTEDGGAALSAAVAEAQRRAAELVVVNTASHDNFAAETYADEKQLDAVRAGVEERGVTVTFRQSSDDEPAEAVLRAAEELGAELVVMGRPPALAGGQADPREHRAAGDPRGAVPRAGGQAQGLSRTARPGLSRTRGSAARRRRTARAPRRAR